MNTSDHPEGPMPAWPPASPPALASTTSEVWDEIPDLGPPPAKMLNAKVVWRAARRHWWQILLLWSLLSGALVALAAARIKTSYDATSWLIVRTSTPRIFDQNSSTADFGRYQKTQVDLVTSPDVLGDTLARHPEIAALPLLHGSDDPEAEIRRLLRVAIRPDTNLITVSLSSEDKDEAVAIVDAVVEAYLLAANDWVAQETKEQITRLNEEARKIKVEIDAKRANLRRLVLSAGSVDAGQLKDQGKVSLERFQTFLSRSDEMRFRRIDLEAQLESARMRAGKMVARGPQSGPDQVKQAFYAHPEVTALADQRERAEAAQAKAKRLAKSPSDPSRVQTAARVKELDEKINKLWVRLGPHLQRDMGEQLDETDKVLQDLETQVAAAKSSESALYETLKLIEIENKTQGGEALEVSFANAELGNAEHLLLSIQRQVQQLEYETKGPARVEKANNRTRVDPSTNKRMKIMAATPFGVLAVVLALFVLVEVRSGRVADPDELSSRVRVEVIAVVPPLPSLRPSRALWGSRDEIRAKRQLEEFMQSLDHLRVALCASRKGGERRRCILITSACSSEGKTTLAAHLAGRCANAGLSTLLIDADLRNPSLSRLLKVPDGPGLSDVLRGEVTAESAMMVIEAGGGFHLLPAGTPGYDPSRLLQGEPLPRLLGQFRQAFDIVIMDAPPVLLVPDALTLGRSSDGALLAVRYDTSRFPLVERAHRRLAAVGVPVIGAVVNGVRAMESSYGYYSYAYHADRSTTPTATFDIQTEPKA
jgi:polysaccharide biosynthesis transport protein